MTREEAREILTHNWTRVDNPNYSESEVDEAIFMAIEALSAKETTAKFAEFQEDIFRLEKELEYYQDRYEAVTRINDAQVETIRTYAAMVKMLEKELKEIKET
jgi:hypothetical protein